MHLPESPRGGASTSSDGTAPQLTTFGALVALALDARRRGEHLYLRWIRQPAGSEPPSATNLDQWTPDPGDAICALELALLDGRPDTEALARAILRSLHYSGMHDPIPGPQKAMTVLGQVLRLGGGGDVEGPALIAWLTMPALLEMWGFARGREAAGDGWAAAWSIGLR